MTYRKMYYFLLGAIEDALSLLEADDAKAATEKLIAAMLEAEEMYVSSDLE